MVIDIIIILLCVIAALLGYKRGFFSVCIKIIGFVLAIFLAYYFCGKLATNIYEKTHIGVAMNMGIEQGITEYIQSVISSRTEDKTNNDNKNNEEPDNTEIFTKLFKLAGVSVEKEIKAEDGTTVEEASPNLVRNIAIKATMIILKVVAFIGIFVAVLIVMAVVSLILNLICKLPILKGANKMGGLIFNLILCVVKIWLVFGILSFIAGFELVKPAITYIESTHLANWLYSNNLLAQIVFTKII